MNRPPVAAGPAATHGADAGAPARLDDRDHAEIMALYAEAGANVRFAKALQWRMLVYFTVLCAAVVGVGVYLRWGDAGLIAMLFYATWVFSFAAALALVLLQVWQGAEHRKMDFLVQYFGDPARAALRRKSRRAGDVHRYLMLALMLLYVELATFAVSRMLWPRF